MVPARPSSSRFSWGAVGRGSPAPGLKRGTMPRPRLAGALRGQGARDPTRDPWGVPWGAGRGAPRSAATLRPGQVSLTATMDRAGRGRKLSLRFRLPVPTDLYYMGQLCEQVGQGQTTDPPVCCLFIRIEKFYLEKCQSGRFHALIPFSSSLNFCYILAIS